MVQLGHDSAPNIDNEKVGQQVNIASTLAPAENHRADKSEPSTTLRLCSKRAVKGGQDISDHRRRRINPPRPMASQTCDLEDDLEDGFETKLHDLAAFQEPSVRKSNPCDKNGALSSQLDWSKPTLMTERFPYA